MARRWLLTCEMCDLHREEGSLDAAAEARYRHELETGHPLTDLDPIREGG